MYLSKAVLVDYIYGLVLDNELIYVGRTQHLLSRFHVHKSTTLKGLSGTTEMVVFECCPRRLGSWAESSWIAIATSWGCTLRNKLTCPKHDYPQKETMKHWLSPEVACRADKTHAVLQHTNKAVKELGVTGDDLVMRGER